MHPTVCSSSLGKRHAHFNRRTSPSLGKRHAHVCMKPCSPSHSPEKRRARPTQRPCRIPHKYCTSRTRRVPPTSFHHASFSGQKPQNHKACHPRSFIIQISLVRNLQSTKLATYLLRSHSESPISSSTHTCQRVRLHHALQSITCGVRTALCGQCPLCDVL